MNEEKIGATKIYFLRTLIKFMSQTHETNILTCSI